MLSVEKLRRHKLQRLCILRPDSTVQHDKCIRQISKYRFVDHSVF